MKNPGNKVTSSIAGSHTDEYDLPVRKTRQLMPIIKGIFAIGAFCLLRQGCWAEDPVANGTGAPAAAKTPAPFAEPLPLRPAKALGPEPEVERPKSAKRAVDEDFAKHRSATESGKRESSPSGATSDSSVAVLKQSAQPGPGPSNASSDSGIVDEIQLKRPSLQSLITVNDYLNPFQLDASSSLSVNLRRALSLGIEQNLDLGISRTITKQKEFAYYSSLGNFLPEPTFGFSEYFASGKVGLPGALATLFGASGTSGNTSIRFHRPFEIMHAGLDFYAYRGGSVLFGAQQSKHNYTAAKHQEKASLSDTLMSITQNYYNLVLAETLLQIRVDAVRTSQEQLRHNEDRHQSGLATQLDVLQSRTQLSRDRQSLVDQQANRRSAAVALADSLNLDLGQDLIPVDLVVRKTRLINPKLNIADILQMAIDNRPELKQYEELRLAAKKAILVAAADLQPSVLLSGNAYGIGPPSNVQALGLFAINANWRLKGLGTVDAFNVQQARWQARQAMLQAQKQLQSVLTQVRNSYLQILDKEKNIEEASAEVQSALEELRLAELRTRSGLGTNLDIITAQRDYTQALVDKAQSLINFNIAQAQLVHDVGLISTDSLTSGRLLGKERAR